MPECDACSASSSLVQASRAQPAGISQELLGIACTCACTHAPNVNTWLKGELMPREKRTTVWAFLDL